MIVNSNNAINNMRLTVAAVGDGSHTEVFEALPDDIDSLLVDVILLADQHENVVARLEDLVAGRSLDGEEDNSAVIVFDVDKVREDERFATGAAEKDLRNGLDDPVVRVVRHSRQELLAVIEDEVVDLAEDDYAEGVVDVELLDAPEGDLSLSHLFDEQLGVGRRYQR